MKIRLDYDDIDDSDSDEDGSLGGGEEGGGDQKRTQSMAALTSILGSNSTADSAPHHVFMDSDDDSDSLSISDSSLLGTNNPVTALDEEDSWQFDLGVMAGRNDKVDVLENATKTSALKLSNTTRDFDTLSKVSIMSEELTVISLEIQEADQAIQHLVAGKEGELKEFRNSKRNRPAIPNTTTATIKKGALTSEFLEQRKTERADRLARARERIAREKRTALQQEQERKQKEEEPRELDMSVEARRDRVYKWYSRCGQPTRKELKKRISRLQYKEGFAVEDVDLLPWNFNGSMINVSRMIGISLGKDEL